MAGADDSRYSLPMSISRRRLLGASAVAAAGLGIAGGSGSAVFAAGTRSQPTPSTGPIWRSSNGVLTGTLTMQPGTARVAGNPLAGVSSYNGTFAGPTMVVRPGDRLDLTLQNRLSTPSNLHFHGLHVSPRGHEDNVFLDIPPGYDFRYRVDIPLDHASGLYWYHPHRHGYVYAQVYSGLAGLIVIEGGAAAYPQVAPLRRRFLNIRNIGIENLGAQQTFVPPSKVTIGQMVTLVNGAYQPNIDMRPGETQFWQIANTSAGAYWKLRIPGATFQVIEEDGVPTWRTWTPDTVFMPPGKRFGVLVTAPAMPVETILMTEAFTQGPAWPWPEATLASVSVSGPRDAPVVLPDVMAARPAHLDEPVARQRVLTLGSTSHTPPPPDFWFDGVPYQNITMENVITATVGTTEEWIIKNTDTLAHSGRAENHPFHLHVNGFCVVDSGEFDPATGTILTRVPADPRGEMDTLSIPPGHWARIRIRFADYVGRTV
ncbi:MAG: multicopper oxidase domain-containing protein, partial [Actinobacteria bacterium]|nr:multicopper oxidase domain-containing protein [Actinomycetota bacterium]